MDIHQILLGTSGYYPSLVPTTRTWVAILTLFNHYITLHNNHERTFTGYVVLLVTKHYIFMYGINNYWRLYHYHWFMKGNISLLYVSAYQTHSPQFISPSWIIAINRHNKPPRSSRLLNLPADYPLRWFLPGLFTPFYPYIIALFVASPPFMDPLSITPP